MCITCCCAAGSKRQAEGGGDTEGSLAFDGDGARQTRGRAKRGHATPFAGTPSSDAGGSSRTLRRSGRGPKQEPPTDVSGRAASGEGQPAPYRTSCSVPAWGVSELWQQDRGACLNDKLGLAPCGTCQAACPVGGGLGGAGLIYSTPAAPCCYWARAGRDVAAGWLWHLADGAAG